MTLLRIAIEVRRLDLAAYALIHSAAVVLASQSVPGEKPPVLAGASPERAGKGPANERC